MTIPVIRYHIHRYSTLKSRGFDPDQLAIVLPTRTASTREKHALTKEKPLSKVACHTLPLSTRAEDQEVVRHELDKLLDRVYLKVAGTA